MRISDGSSDVCSSDLTDAGRARDQRDAAIGEDIGSAGRGSALPPLVEQRVEFGRNRLARRQHAHPFLNPLRGEGGLLCIDAVAGVAQLPAIFRRPIGRGSCGGRVGLYGYIEVDAVTVKTKT